jgi:thioredoxin-related protein
MRSSLLVCLLSLAIAIPASAASEWKTDFEAAKAQARKENKVLLLDFTGSDWCGWCIKMKKDTLDLQAFKDYAAKNLVLVEVDFPSRKTLPAAQKKANETLKNKYGIEGYPTFVVVDASGKELGRQVGYLEGGPEAFISKIEQMKKKPGSTG